MREHEDADSVERSKHQVQNLMKIKAAHSQSIEDVLTKLDTDPEYGLGSREASRRLEKHGPNKLEEREKVSIWRILLDQVNSPLAYLLAAAAILAFAQLLHVFDMRDADEPIFRNQVTRNKYAWMAVVLCTAALAVVYFTPVLRELLGFEQMGMREWGLVAVASILPILIIQLLKKIFKLF